MFRPEGCSRYPTGRSARVHREKTFRDKERDEALIEAELRSGRLQDELDPAYCKQSS